jgi:DNA adenine methylase
LLEKTAQQILFPDLRTGLIKPLLKWAGGKSQLLPVLREAIPVNFTRYVEPFFGGGALFWDVALSGSLIADSNPELIHFYTVVRDLPEALLEAVNEIPITKEHFYRVRSQVPDSLSPIQRAARFVYLNKTCYNGLYRVNRKGQFNTPFGGKTNVTILEEENVLKASELLKQSELACADYRIILPKLKRGDFVYFDPPYMPIGRYSDFRRYTTHFFSEKDQINLAEEFSKLAGRGIKALLSNSFNKLILSLYKGHWHKYVQANRQINSRPKGRGKIMEILVSNYPLEGFDVLS